jgi:aryl carrier-like protein
MMPRLPCLQGIEMFRHLFPSNLTDLLNATEDAFDGTLNVRANGVDSLIEMEFRTWLAKELGATVPLKDLAEDLTQLSARNVEFGRQTSLRLWVMFMEGPSGNYALMGPAQQCTGDLKRQNGVSRRFTQKPAAIRKI